jgi:acyl-CoA thioesterase-1
MSWVIYLFGSGAAFFLGAGLVLAGLAVVTFVRWKGSPLVATLLALVGMAVVVLSATPLPYWFYAVAITVSLAWLVAERFRQGAVQRSRPWLRGAALAAWAVAVLAEFPYQFTPSADPMGRPPLHLFGDSVAAGMGEAAAGTWPNLLARSHALELHNYSQPGATAATMVRKARAASLGEGIILLEIGGNDLLGTTSAEDFESSLDELLSMVCGPGRAVWMFELPLPPLANEFGRTQRRLAARYGVRLIPKRIFIGVLTAGGATVDSIHLTPAGHERMAETVWGLLRPAYIE